MVPISILDVVPIPEGCTAAAALSRTIQAASAAEHLGYNRYWVAEFHGSLGIASSATSVVVGYLAAKTKSIRVGAGGIMLPNHSPLIIAEQFGTLESIYPGRIDLGVGRSTGADEATSRAIRKITPTVSYSFANEIDELRQYFSSGDSHHQVRAVPGQDLDLPIWVLGSRLEGAQVAAQRGLPFAFAHHFSPDSICSSLAAYRDNYIPSAKYPKPYVMAAITLCAANTDAEAQYLFTSLQQSLINRRRGVPGKLPHPRPVREFYEALTPEEQTLVASAFRHAFVGCATTLTEEVSRFLAEHHIDELMITSAIFDQSHRIRSLEIAAQLRDCLKVCSSVHEVQQLGQNSIVQRTSKYV